MYICNKSVLFQAFATLSDALEPLAEGVRRNKQHWLDRAAKSSATPNHMDMGE